MPILVREPDLYPDNLFERGELGNEPHVSWLALYCLSRHEKQLVRRLRKMEVASYCPLIPKRTRSPSGRVRTSHLPLFPGYVFAYADESQRYAAITTGCVSRCLVVPDGAHLTSDLRQLHRLIEAGIPLTPEARLTRGIQVRVLSGPFCGLEGVIIRRENKKRLLVAVDYLQRGASILLEDCQLEPLELAASMSL